MSQFYLRKISEDGDNGPEGVGFVKTTGIGEETTYKEYHAT